MPRSVGAISVMFLPFMCSGVWQVILSSWITFFPFIRSQCHRYPKLELQCHGLPDSTAWKRPSNIPGVRFCRELFLRSRKTSSSCLRKIPAGRFSKRLSLKNICWRFGLPVNADASKDFSLLFSRYRASSLGRVLRAPRVSSSSWLFLKSKLSRVLSLCRKATGSWVNLLDDKSNLWRELLTGRQSASISESRFSESVSSTRGEWWNTRSGKAVSSLPIRIGSYY